MTKKTTKVHERPQGNELTPEEMEEICCRLGNISKSVRASTNMLAMIRTDIQAMNNELKTDTK